VSESVHNLDGTDTYICETCGRPILIKIGVDDGGFVFVAAPQHDPLCPVRRAVVPPAPTQAA
jgi:hypothetical protein